MAEDKNPNGPAFTKRLKISKTQQQTLLITMITAIILGVCLVLGIYFVKYIKMIYNISYCYFIYQNNILHLQQIFQTQIYIMLWLCQKI